MPKREAHITLRAVLTKLFSNKSDAMRVAGDAGLNTALIDFSDSVLNVWENILTQAEKEGKVDALIAVAKNEYPQPGKLQQAAQHYNAAPDDPIDTTDQALPQTDSKPATIIHTNGGSVFIGDMNTGGGDFVGRDKTNNNQSVQSAQPPANTNARNEPNVNQPTEKLSPPSPKPEKYQWPPQWPQERPQDAQSISNWLNATSLRVNPFGPIGAGDDPDLPEYYFYSEDYSRKICGRRSTLSFGSLGSGKTAAALLRVNDCRMPEGNPRQPDCFPVYIDLNSNTDCIYGSSIQMVIHKIGLELLGFLALNPGAFLAASKRNQDAMKSTMVRVAGTTQGIVTNLQKRGLSDDHQAKQFVDQLSAESIQTFQMSDELWLEDLKYICPYGFKYLTLVVDVHTYQWQRAETRTPVNQFKDCLQSLIDLIPRLSKTQVCVKMFLPDICRAALVLPASIEKAPLAWGMTDMKQMLASRLTWANGSGNFNTLFDPASRNRTPSPTELFVNAAKNSPLRLIQLGNRLIETHVERYPTKAEFSYEELEAILTDVT